MCDPSSVGREPYACTRIVPTNVMRAPASVKENFAHGTSVLACRPMPKKRPARKSKAAQELARRLHAKLTPEERSAAARKAALARWAKRRPSSSE